MTTDVEDASISGNELKQFVERIENIEEQKAVLSDLIKEVYGELKGRGYIATAIRKIITLRKKAAEERVEEEAILDLYLQALGMS